MSIFNLFKGQLSKVIEWQNPPADVLWQKNPSERDEIINASKLIVAPGQGCILVYEGKIADTITEAGVFNLKTDNHPFITTLLNLRQNFESEHKLQIFFFKTTQIIGQNWGTHTPIKWVDPEYKLPMEVGFNGNFSYQIADPSLFFTEIVGAVQELKTDYLKNIIVERLLGNLAAAIHQNTYSFVNLDSQLPEMSAQLKRELNTIFTPMGLNLTDFRVVGSKIDYATTQRIGRIADVTADTKAAAEAGLSYVELERTRALRDAARNEGGVAGAGLQFGLGTELGKQMVTPEKQQYNSSFIFEQIRELKLLADEGIISFEDFEQKKNDLLKTL